MVGWRLVLPVGKRIVPLRTLAGAMSARPSLRPEPEERVVRLAGWIFGSRPVTGGDSCLERSLVLYRYLSRSNRDARLVVGFRDGEGVLEGHAWVAVGDRSLGADTDDRGAYVPAFSFGARDLGEERTQRVA